MGTNLNDVIAITLLRVVKMLTLVAFSLLLKVNHCVTHHMSVEKPQLSQKQSCPKL